MSVLDDLRRLSSAGDIVTNLEVDYDPRVQNGARLHNQRRKGDDRAEEPGAPASACDAELRARCRAHLRAAHDGFVGKSPLEARLFKVHKQAARDRQDACARTAPVPLVSITGPVT